MGISRNSRYYDLRWIIECKPPGQAFYEVIAAFNCEPPAMSYFNECRKVHEPNWTYRVSIRNAKGEWEAQQTAQGLYVLQDNRS